MVARMAGLGHSARWRRRTSTSAARPATRSTGDAPGLFLPSLCSAGPLLEVLLDDTAGWATLKGRTMTWWPPRLLVKSTRIVDGAADGEVLLAVALPVPFPVAGVRVERATCSCMEPLARLARSSIPIASLRAGAPEKEIEAPLAVAMAIRDWLSLKRLPKVMFTTISPSAGTLSFPAGAWALK